MTLHTLQLHYNTVFEVHRDKTALYTCDRSNWKWLKRPLSQVFTYSTRLCIRRTFFLQFFVSNSGKIERNWSQTPIFFEPVKVDSLLPSLYVSQLFDYFQWKQGREYISDRVVWALREIGGYRGQQSPSTCSRHSSRSGIHTTDAECFYKVGTLLSEHWEDTVKHV